MKKHIAAALTVSLLLGGCAQATQPPAGIPAKPSSQMASSAQAGLPASSADSPAGTLTITDVRGSTMEVPENPKTVCLYGSYADAWLLAGGSLIGTTEDAVEERGLDVGDAEIVGTVKEPNTEKIISLDPDLVLLSADITSQNDIRDVLEDAGLTCAYFQVDTFEDYAAMMAQFCKITGKQELFDANVTHPQQQIEAVKAAVPAQESSPNILLIRAFSSGIKAKTDDELAGVILKELGCHNIADDHPSMLEDLSLEEVIQADPDYIFVTTMGSEKKALEYLDSLILANPAWQGLTAVQENRYHVLPKELFHYKPNNRWGESYEYLAEILYPGLDLTK